jgi:hypothetical protein
MSEERCPHREWPENCWACDRAELAACRDALTLIAQWQVSDGSSIHSPGKAEYSKALASVQDIACAALKEKT